MDIKDGQDILDQKIIQKNFNYKLYEKFKKYIPFYNHFFSVRL